MKEPTKSIPKLILRILAPILLIALTAFIFFKFIFLFMPFIVAYLLVLIIKPVGEFIIKKLKIKNKTIKSIIRTASIIMFFALIIFVCYLSFSKVPEISQSLLIGLEPFKEQLEGTSIANIISKIYTKISEYPEQTTKLLQEAGTIFSNLPQILVKIIVTILGVFFIINSDFKPSKALEKLIPSKLSKHYEIIKENASKMSVQYFIAAFKMSGIVFVICLIGLLILHRTAPIPVAFFISIVDFLPIFGSGAVLWPWAAYCVLTGQYHVAAGLMIIYLVIQSTRQLLHPKIFGDTMGISSLLSLVYMYIGFLISGISGMIFAVPIGVFITNLYNAGMFDTIISDTKELISIIYNYLYSDENN